MNVLFVCTGNICRSPTAEAVFRRQVAQAGLDGAIEVDSAGTGDWHLGEAPDSRAQAAARRRGYDLGGHRARKVGRADFDRCDLILAMDRHHLRTLERARPQGARARLALLMDYAPALGGDEVPDPYYGADADFETVLDMVEVAGRGLLAALRAEID